MNKVFYFVISLGVIISINAYAAEKSTPLVVDPIVECIQSQGAEDKKVISASCGGGGSGGGTGQSYITVQCESWHYDTEICYIPSGVLSVQLINQISETDCTGLWSFSGNTVAAYNGCRAVFKVFLNRNVQIATSQCESWGYSYTPCSVPVAGNSTIWLQARQSSHSCKRNASWGYSGILWVHHGCRGTFASIY